MGQTSSSHKISAQDRAVLDLKNQRDKIQKYQRQLVSVSAKETDIARECIAHGDKRRALLALRRKKYQQSLLDKTYDQLGQLESLVSQVEFAQVQQSVIYGLQQGTAVLKELNAAMDISKVEKLMEDNEEAQAYQKEVGQILSGKLGNQEEDEVEDELEALQSEIGDSQIHESQPASVVLPDAPTEELVTGNEDRPMLPEEEKRRQRQRALARKAREEGQQMLAA